MFVPAGLIPAYAGRTSSPGTHLSRGWAHPRLRGADPYQQPTLKSQPGSSPLTRGGPHHPAPICRGDGLIPAYAGRTNEPMALGWCGWAHPRLRGADLHGVFPLPCCWGSSPLTRGGLFIPSCACASCGLIPAYAGRTREEPDFRPAVQAHPRLRGADLGLSIYDANGKGSSPLTRGGLHKGDRVAQLVGLIPAYAGRTLTDQRGRAETRLADPTYGVTVSVGEHFGQHSSRCGVELLMVQWFFA